MFLFEAGLLLIAMSLNTENVNFSCINFSITSSIRNGRENLEYSNNHFI